MGEFDEEEPQASRNSQIMMYGFFVLVVFLLYVFYRDKFEPVNLFWSYTSYFILVILLGKSFMVTLRHVSPKGIFHPIVTTIIGKPFTTAGEWNLYSMGDIYTKVSLKRGGEGFHWCFNNGTIITPIESDNEVGLNHIGLCDHKEVKLKDLPVVVLDKLLAYGRKPPYWFGLSSTQLEKKAKEEKTDLTGFVKSKLSPEAFEWFTQKGKVKTITISHLTQQLEEAYKLSNLFRSMYNEMKNEVEAIKSMFSRLSEAEKKGVKQRATEYFLGKAGEA